jgi:hypothetical protein
MRRSTVLSFTLQLVFPALTIKLFLIQVGTRLDLIESKDTHDFRTIAASYWSLNGQKFEVEIGSLGFSVTVFCIEAVVSRSTSLDRKSFGRQTFCRQSVKSDESNVVMPLAINQTVCRSNVFRPKEGSPFCFFRSLIFHYYSYTQWIFTFGNVENF